MRTTTAAALLGLCGALSIPVVAESGSGWETVQPGGETRCADGSPYRFYVRRADSERVMLFFNGGGACWSAETCDPAANPADGRFLYRMAAGADWGNDPRQLGGAFDLDNPENPFRDWTQVFAAYCTGDVHLGTADHTYTTADGGELVIAHRGRINAQAVLEYTYGAFPAARTLLVSGASAGAISSPYFAAEVAGHYPDAQVIQFAGGGGGYRMPPPESLWRNWSVFRDLPEWLQAQDYREDTTGLVDWYLAAAAAYPAIRFHQYDNAYDQVQDMFQGLLGYPAPLLPGLDANRAELEKALPHFRSYTAPGTFHTLLRYPELYSRETSGVRALDWVRDLAAGKVVDNIHCDASCGQPNSEADSRATTAAAPEGV
ncbi:pectin acetylesterase-family hydrolase [Parahaliea aestuarii]|nr:pectin acetylesterase-family hydrolase [Parahaliea aestuarii]